MLTAAAVRVAIPIRAPPETLERAARAAFERAPPAGGPGTRDARPVSLPAGHLRPSQAGAIAPPRGWIPQPAAQLGDCQPAWSPPASPEPPGLRRFPSRLQPPLGRLAGSGRSGEPGRLSSERHADREFDGELRRGLDGRSQHGSSEQTGRRGPQTLRCDGSSHTTALRGVPTGGRAISWRSLTLRPRLATSLPFSVLALRSRRQM